MFRRRTLIVGAFAAPAVVHAQALAWPQRPVRFINPFTPGSAVDVVARLIARDLSERLGQQFIVDNRTGASGIIGTEAAARRSWLVKRYSSAFGRSLASRYDSAARRIAFCHTNKSRNDLIAAIALPSTNMLLSRSQSYLSTLPFATLQLCNFATQICASMPWSSRSSRGRLSVTSGPT